MAVDLFCCGGGASRGLADAGFAVLGVDVRPQRLYPYAFYLGDALAFELPPSTALVWASPPCQRHSKLTKQHGSTAHHPDLIPATRRKLARSGVPYILENVPGAPLRNAVTLCGSMFGLAVRRHRLFECSFPVPQPPCRHDLQPRTVGVYGKTGGRSTRDGIAFGSLADWRAAMGIDWLSSRKLAQAIPPAYAAYLASYAPRPAASPTPPRGARPGRASNAPR